MTLSQWDPGHLFPCPILDFHFWFLRKMQMLPSDRPVPKTSERYQGLSRKAYPASLSGAAESIHEPGTCSGFFPPLNFPLTACFLYYSLPFSTVHGNLILEFKFQFLPSLPSPPLPSAPLPPFSLGNPSHVSFLSLPSSRN